MGSVMPVDEELASALEKLEHVFVLSDPSKKDDPIVFASDGFFELTGYSKEEVLGRNCRFLQGPKTDHRAITEIRDAIREERPCQVRLLNYKKNGEEFWNLFHLTPLFCRDSGRVLHHLGLQTDITALVADASQDALDAIDRHTLSTFRCALPPPACHVAHKGRKRVLGEVGEVAVHAHAQEHARDGKPCAMAEGEEAAPCCAHAHRDKSDKGEGEGEGEDDHPHHDKRPPACALSAALSRAAQGAATCLVDGDAAVALDAALHVPESLGAASGDVVRVLAGASHGREVEAKPTGATPGPGHLNTALAQSLMKIQQSFVLSDPNLPDCPIIYASDRFCQLSGYPRHEVENRNCRFLQGPQTDPRTVQAIRTATAEGRPCTVRLLNYRKDGTPFWNSLHISPVRNAEGKITYFVGVQLDVSEAVSVAPTEASKDTVPATKSVPASGAQAGAGEADGGVVPCPAAEFVNNNARVLQLGAAGAVKVAVRGLQSAILHRRMADGSSAGSSPSPSLQ